MQITVTAIKLTSIAVVMSITAALAGLFIGYLAFGSNDAIALKNSEAQVEQLKTDLAKTKTELADEKKRNGNPFSGGKTSNQAEELAEKDRIIKEKMKDINDLKARIQILEKRQPGNPNSEISQAQINELRKELNDAITEVNSLNGIKLERDRLVKEFGMLKELQNTTEEQLTKLRNNLSRNEMPFQQMEKTIDQLKNYLNMATAKTVMLENAAELKHEEHVEVLEKLHEIINEQAEEIKILKAGSSSTERQTTTSSTERQTTTSSTEGQTTTSSTEGQTTTSSTEGQSTTQQITKHNLLTDEPLMNELIESLDDKSKINLEIPESNFFKFSENTTCFEYYRAYYYETVKDEVQKVFDDAKQNLDENFVSKKDITDLILLTAYSNIALVKAIKNIKNKQPDTFVTKWVGRGLRNMDIIALHNSIAIELKFIPFRTIGMFFHKLKILNITGCKITNEMLDDSDFKVAMKTHFSGLTTLNFIDNDLRDFPNLSAPELAKLQFIDLSRNNHLSLKNDEKLIDLLPPIFKIQSDDASNNGKLSIKGTEITQAAVDALRAANPGINVYNKRS